MAATQATVEMAQTSPAPLMNPVAPVALVE
jgi:hypothetical protein